MASRGFTCCCELAKATTGGCLFGARAGLDRVVGPAKAAMDGSLLAVRGSALTVWCALAPFRAQGSEPCTRGWPVAADACVPPSCPPPLRPPAA